MCLRFIAVSHILSDQQTSPQPAQPASSSPAPLLRPVVVPPEELASIQKEFMAQVAHLFQVTNCTY